MKLIKLTSIIVLLVLLAGIMPVVANARSTFFDNNTNYTELTDGGSGGTGVVPGNVLNELVSLSPGGKGFEGLNPKNFSATTKPIDLGPTVYLFGIMRALMDEKNETMPAEIKNRMTELETALNNPTDWMEVVTDTEGNGFGCYIILHDQTGATIRKDGTLTIRVFDTEYTQEHVYLEWMKEYPVTSSEFIDTTQGIGAFEHKIVALNVGRIPYSEFRKRNFGVTPVENPISVRAEFSTTNGTLYGKTTQIVD